MKKKLIRLTESDLHRIVKESVKKILNEENSVFYNDRPSRITKIDRSNNIKHTISPDEEEKLRNFVSESQLHQIIKESVEQAIDEGVGDYFGAIRRGWNTPLKSYEFGNTKGALRAMDSIENRALQHQMNTERGIGLQGYNTKFEQDVKNWLRGDTVRINDKMTPKTQQYWRQVKAKADEILNNHGKEKVMGVLGATRSRF